ncbi:hypothetical protein Pcinc_024787 [Petrolisthes cinctipes]|uniref:Uncharacterized protein n=1 Tax=Petrolisthes cinctipes TaxID=88211 RepID=A0AAE1KCH9_PETCI|nr:hypothetical protein Pcinc_024787 [Petrolisthes cinctipes]
MGESGKIHPKSTRIIQILLERLNPLSRPSRLGLATLFIVPYSRREIGQGGREGEREKGGVNWRKGLEREKGGVNWRKGGEREKGGVNWRKGGGKGKGWSELEEGKGKGKG